MYNIFNQGVNLENSKLGKHNSTFWTILYGVLIGLIFGGLIWFFISPKKEFAIELLAAPIAAPIFVEVDGAVNSPGLFEVPVDSRVNDVIALADGFAENALTVSINLAMPLYDGLQIIVPAKIDTTINSISIDNTTDTNEFVNINFADFTTLCSLPSIGESKAQAIIDYRNDHGYFQSIDEIMQVTGIGEGIFDDINDLITI